MIRPPQLLGLGAFLGAGLLLTAQALVPERLPSWLGGRPDPLALALDLLEAARQQPAQVVLVASCPDGAAPARYLLVPGTLTPDRLRWTRQENTLVIHAPRPIADTGACAADEDTRTAADEAAREVLRRQVLLPLLDAGHGDIKVKVTFAAPPPTSTPDTDAKD
jgi:hypothetical protein